MTITAEQLSQAFSPFTQVAKGDPIPVDLEKVADAIVSEARALHGGDGDPDEKVTALETRLDAIEKFLDEVEVTDDGATFVKASGEVAELAKEFQVETPEAADPETTPPATDEPSTVDTTKVDEDADDGTWPKDMAPKKVPTLKAERLTAAERPVPARVGAGASVKKHYGAARDRVFGRDPSERTLS